MGNTIYASFNDPSKAEKAAGALLDHGVRAADLSIVSSHSGGEVTTTSGSSMTSGDRDNDVKNTADAGMGYVAAAGDKVQEWGARGMAGVNDALGNDAGERKWEAEANRQNDSAETNVNRAGGELNNAIDSPGTGGTSSYTAARTSGDGDNDVKNAGDSAMGYAAGAGDKVQEWGARGMAGVNDALGNDAGEAKWEAEADKQNMEARQNFGAAGAEARDSVDMNSGRETQIGSPTYTSSTSATTDSDRDHTEAAAKQGISTTTAADAGAGAVKGAGWGLGVGALAALASLVVPGVGIVLGGGALAAALGGVAAATGAGAAAGAVTGYLKDQGVEGHIAEDYDRTVQGGGAILAVSAPSGDCTREEIIDVLNKYGAANVNAYDARSTSTGSGYVA
jgi:hypothetical protein